MTQEQCDKVNEASFYISRIINAWSDNPTGDFDLSGMRGHKYLNFLLREIWARDIAISNSIVEIKGCDL